jgi:hypothetical protein
LVELAGIGILLIGSVYAGIESNRTWNMLAALGAFLGCLIVGFVLMAVIPFVGWLVAVAPAVGIVRHAQSTRFRRLANEPDEAPLGLIE